MRFQSKMSSSVGKMKDTVLEQEQESQEKEDDNEKKAAGPELSESESIYNLKVFNNKLDVFVQNSRSFRNLLNTSKGRDKFCQLLQYNAHLYITCMRHSEEFGEITDQFSSYKKAKVFESQVSNGRKIFRLLLWLNEIPEIHNIINSDKLSRNLKILKTISASCSFIYYFTDNIVWLSKIGFLSKFVPLSKRLLGRDIKWGKIKD